MEGRLDLASWATMVEGLIAGGVRRVRITGGEPLLHKDLVEIVRRLAAFPLIEDLALTTNATRLAHLARPLRNAGLRRMTISIDSLDATRFARMTRGGDLSLILAGIEAAREAAFEEIKLNTVVVRGENEDELIDITRFAWDKSLIPRFLEVMAIGEGAKLADRVVSVAEMRRTLRPLLAAEDATRDRDRGPARYVRSRKDPSRRVGFISGTTDTYCAGCDRLRVSSEGMLRPCLATEDGVAASAAARSGDEKEVARALERAWKMKPDGATWKGCAEPTAASLSIRAIGG